MPYLSDQQLAAKLTQQVMANIMAATGLKAVSATPGGSYGHGPGGLFGNPALERSLYSAVIAQPFSGLQFALPVRGTTVTDPLDGIITGVTATVGDEPNGACDDPPTTGVVKLCQHSFPLGLFSRQTPVYDVRHGNRVASRGEHRDFQVFGDPFGASGTNPFAPTVPGTSANEMANTESGKIIYAWMVAWARDFAGLLYTGTPVNNKAGGGYKEFYGLEKLINTGYRDAESGQACPAADSIVRSFANQNVRSAGADIVRDLIQMFFVLQSNANKMNLSPARWVLTMPESLFYELTAIWPCSYLTDGCTFSNTQARVNIDAGDQVRMRDEMRGDLANRTGQHLKMFGQNVPVIVDDTIPEVALGGGVQKASIYFVPMQVLGGQPVTYIEYMDYNAIEVPAEAAKFAPEGHFTVTDNGRFLLHRKPPTNTCVQIAAWTEPRLKLLTPFLAGRLDNVAYNRLPDLRSGDPDSSYFVNGGLTNRNAFAPSYYPPTS